MPLIRTFLALPLSDASRTVIADIQRTLRNTAPEALWEDSSKFHITLKFLGNTEEYRLSIFTATLRQKLETIPAFSIVSSCLGTYPDADQPRIVWFGIRPDTALLQLQHTVEQLCTEFGFQREEYPFHPHVTLARIKGNMDMQHLTQMIKTRTLQPIQESCREVLLWKSELRPEGSLYTTLQSFPLQ
jgi:2'-5' RNA ligase